MNPNGISTKTASVCKKLLNVNKIIVSIKINTIGPEYFNELPVSAWDLIWPSTEYFIEG